ncbi:MAG TPA: putative quinol monooxygenase [Microvirga sp.]|jgi:quinol monooxygenase YgiN
MRSHVSADGGETAPGFAYYNEGFVVAISLVAKEGEEENVARLLEGLVAPTMAEDGVKLFLPYRSPDDKASFFLFELYRDQAGWDAHQETAHFKEAIKELAPRLSKRERLPFIPFAVS